MVFAWELYTCKTRTDHPSFCQTKNMSKKTWADLHWVSNVMENNALVSFSLHASIFFQKHGIDKRFPKLVSQNNVFKKKTDNNSPEECLQDVTPVCGNCFLEERKTRKTTIPTTNKWKARNRTLQLHLHNTHVVVCNIHNRRRNPCLYLNINKLPKHISFISSGLWSQQVVGFFFPFFFFPPPAALTTHQGTIRYCCRPKDFSS